MEEKVLYVKLPEDDKYRKVAITEDGIPKPERLLGGTEVYQKEGVPYWYCKIKNGRDEFMHLYTEDLVEEDLYFDSKTGKKRHFVTNEEQEFLENALRALENKPKEGYRWLPVFEPSADGKGGLQFVCGERPEVGFDCYKWQKLMTEYSPENESGKCSIHTYFLLQLRWLKEGIVTLEQLADDSKDIGHYRDSENAKHDVELTGQREFGGLYGLIGNTWKMLGDPNSKFGFSVVGGDCYDDGKEHPAADVFRIRNSNFKDNNTVGLLELKK